MMKIKNRLLSLIIFCASEFSYAGTDAVQNVQITKIQAYESSVSLKFSPAFDNTQGCTHSTIKDLAAIDFDSNKGKEMYSLVLTAVVSDKPVSLYLNGCDSSGVPSIYRVDVGF